MDVDILAVYTAIKSSPTEVQPKRGVWSKEEGHGAGGHSVLGRAQGV